LGKPYQSELTKLAATYAWALHEDTACLSTFVRESAESNLYVTGSGGSYSAAAFAAFLTQFAAGQHGSAVTPLELCSLPHIRRSSVLIFSAGGNNSDILAAFQSAVSREPLALGIVCLRPDSKLARQASLYEFVQVFAHGAPAGKDGFLATNSLLAFFTLAHRIYCPGRNLPPNYEQLRSLCDYSAKDAESVLSRESLVVLYGPSTKAAALDLESKMSEAALVSVQLADYRNFAHGRHHWIAKKGKQTGVVAFVSPDDADLSRRTLRFVQGLCPSLMIETTAVGSIASIACLPSVFELTGLAGKMRKIDPGRPGVPEFGRRIYNLPLKRKRSLPGGSPDFQTVIERKLESLPNPETTEQRELWRRGAVSYLRQIQEATFRTIVCDFDNTLCGLPERFGQLRKDVTAQLERLVQCGIRIGVATGRGKSVRTQMQQSLKQSLWAHFTVAYYNGAEIASLADNSRPAKDTKPDEWFDALSRSIASDKLLAQCSSITTRAQQVTLEPRMGISLEWLWREAVRSVTENGSWGKAKVIHSTRSVDIVDQKTSKTVLLDAFAAEGIAADAVLCIGDLGRFPGNDFELLRHPHSLSCDKSSNALDECWNLAPAGFRGVQATLYYLSLLKKVKGGVKLRLPDLR